MSDDDLELTDEAKALRALLYRYFDALLRQTHDCYAEGWQQQDLEIVVPESFTDTTLAGSTCFGLSLTRGRVEAPMVQPKPDTYAPRPR